MKTTKKIKNENIVKNNVVFQYINGSTCSWRNVLLFVRDLIFYEENIKKIKYSSPIYIICDTNAANIDKYMKNIENHLQINKVNTILINRQDAKLKIIQIPKILIKTTYDVYMFLFKKFFFSKKDFIYYLFLNFINKNQQILSSKFSNSRTIVFYEKSLLSMILYVFASKYEVIQHGVPTHTYWPSLAQKYYIWGGVFKKTFSDSCKAEIKILGYPGTIITTQSVKKYDILFFSQIGSSPTLVNDCILVREYINFLSNKYKVLVKLHTNELKNRHSFSSKVTIANQHSDIDKLIDMSHSVCSYYSTALLIAANKEAKVFRIIPDHSNTSDPLLFIGDIIPKIMISNKNANPLKISKNVGPLFERLNCEVIF